MKVQYSYACLYVCHCSKCTNGLESFEIAPVLYRLTTICSGKPVNLDPLSSTRVITPHHNRNFGKQLLVGKVKLPLFWDD